METREVEGKPNGSDYPDSGSLPSGEGGDARAKAIASIDAMKSADPQVWQRLSELVAQTEKSKDDPNVWQVMSNTVEFQKNHPELRLWKLLELLISEEAQGFLPKLAEALGSPDVGRPILKENDFDEAT